MKNLLQKNNKKYFLNKNILFFLTIFLINSPALYAYAGPGAAIGAILVFLTVLLAFFASTLIRVFNLSKIILKKLIKSDIKHQEKKIKKNKR